MYIIPIGWLYVTMMMAVAEATSTNGTILGGIITFVLYGLMPTGIIAYLMATPARKRAIKAREKLATAEFAAVPSNEAPIETTAARELAQPDASGHAPAAAQAGAVTPVRKES